MPLGRQNSTATLEKQFGSFLKGKQTLAAPFPGIHPSETKAYVCIKTYMQISFADLLITAKKWK